MFCPESHSISYKMSCRWLLLVLVLEVPRQDQAVNKGQLLLVLGLGQISKRYKT